MITTLSQNSQPDFERISVMDGDTFYSASGEIFTARWKRSEHHPSILKLTSDKQTLTVGAYEHVFAALGLEKL